MDNLHKYEFEIWQDGIPVVFVGSDDLDGALREVRHYAAVYSQDGPIDEIKGTSEGARAFLESLPLAKEA